MLIASANGEVAVLLVIGVLGLLFGGAVYLVPGVFDAATRLRLRMLDRPDDDGVTLERDRSRRRFIALIMCIGSAAILASALNRL